MTAERFSQQWHQTSLTPPTVLEVTLKIGIIEQEDHAQGWYEVKDPTTNVLLGMGSVHHFRLRNLSAEMQRLAVKLVTEIEHHISPF